MKIKNIVMVLLVAFILASCAPAVTVVPTETSVPTSTATKTPAPTSTPQPTATATEIPDSNAPPKGDWTKREKVNGKYVYYKEVEGRPYEWVVEDIKMINGETLRFTDWARPVTKGTKNGKLGDPMYLIPKDSHGWPGVTKNMLPMKVSVLEETEFSASIYANSVSGLTFEQKASSFPNLLLGDNMWFPFRKNNPKATVDDFMNLVDDGKYVIDISGLGSFKINGISSYDVIVLDKNTVIDGKPFFEHSQVIKWKGLWGEYFYSLVGMDADGNLIHIVASTKPFESLNRRQQSAMLLVPILDVLWDSDISAFATNGMDGDLKASERLYRGDNSVPFIAIEP